MDELEIGWMTDIWWMDEGTDECIDGWMIEVMDD